MHDFREMPATYTRVCTIFCKKSEGMHDFIPSSEVRIMHTLHFAAGHF